MFVADERRPVDPRDTNIDPQRLLDLHDVLLSQVQDDARARQAWEESNVADARRRREELRQEWRAHHEHMRALHASLSEEHAAKASALSVEGAGPR